MKHVTIFIVCLLISGLCLAQSKNGFGRSFKSRKKEKAEQSSNKPAMKAEQNTVPFHHEVHLHKKDTATLEGKHHQRQHIAVPLVQTSNPIISASSSRDHVNDLFNQSYNSLIKGIVYKKGSNEILNNTKIILETGKEKIDSSITAIGGMYTLRVQNPTSRHQIYVYKKGYKPLLIEIPDTLLDKKACVVKIQLEPDGTNAQEDRIMIVLRGKVVNASTGLAIPGAAIILRNNMDKTTQQLICDGDGKYNVELKKYSHYTVSALKGSCESEKINKSTIPIKVSTVMDMDLQIACP